MTESPTLLPAPIGRMADLPEPQLAYTILQAASNLGIGRTTVYSLIRAGELTPLKIRQRTVIRHDDLVALLDRRGLAQTQKD